MKALVGKGTPQEQTLAQLVGATVFSTLDANQDFALSREFALLTTFISPYGRYCFNFGISLAPKHFQRQMSTILSGVTGVVCLMDNILIHGKLNLNIIAIWRKF